MGKNQKIIILSLLAITIASVRKVSETTESVTTETINKEKRRAVALTFDDGPHGEYTPQILDILEEQQV